ncbi:adenylate/guanylate cyclase domain-containing protein [Gordonia sp. i37]|uniref:adenylate/guanylate cyclase domain-containing protein n=1 Tax=Gordonia sp. i37 TaxID=1961707 RepID=UPI001557E249|nr:adenylate/guanylate cyclase domain-containing protein [Gordonia sp. i37]
MTAASSGIGARMRGWGARSLSIQSKLLVMLLAVSIASVVACGIIGYLSGTSSLRKSVNDNLTQLRESRTSQIETFFRTTTDTVATVSHGQTVISATRDFSAAFDQLESEPPTLSTADQTGLADYYRTVFAPTLQKATGTTVDPLMFLPTDPAAAYLQSKYTVPPAADWDKAIAVQSAGDASQWSQVHARNQPYFQDLTTRFSYEDTLLINRQGRVVYSAYKGVDLGTDLRSGPFQSSTLATGFAKALNATSADTTVVTDFSFYPPALGKPVAWVLSPVGTGDDVDGVMAVQIPLDGINAVMTGDGQWSQDGLGETGETFLVGSDHLMRSTSRMLETDPQRYRSEVIDAGTPASVADRIVASRNPVLLQPVSGAATSALANRTGLAETTDYLGNQVLAAYRPVSIAGLNWALVATINTDEALAPVDDFARNVALATAAIVVIVCLLSLLLARVFTRPLRTLNAAAREVSAGNYGGTVSLRSRDELGDLATSFNAMSRSLETKQALIDKQREENDDLLATLMPDTVAQRYREGETQITEDHRDVSVVFAELAGLDEYTNTLPADDAVAIRSAFADSVEVAARAHGLERVQTLRGGFLTCCGLTVPRVDHTDRSTRFALDVQATVRRLNAQFGTEFALRAGIDSGAVSAGLVGSRSMVYELWGEALELAYRVHAATGSPGIFVSDRVHDTLAQTYPFTEAGVADGQPVWALDEAAQ